MIKSSKLIKKINEAMEILGDKQKRMKYDRDLEKQERGLTSSYYKDYEYDDDFWSDVPSKSRF